MKSIILSAIITLCAMSAQAFEIPLGTNSIALPQQTITAFDVRDIRYDYASSSWIISAQAVLSGGLVQSESTDVSILHTVTIEVPRIVVTSAEVGAVIGETYNKTQLDGAITTIAMGKVLSVINQ